MTFIIVLVSILQSFAISLGVGSSTLAIVNFFAAISDGTIEPTERRMMGIVYVILRISMIAILVTSLFLFIVNYSYGAAATAFAWAQLTALGVLFINAMLMTAHIIPSTFGPAIQAGSWYTLGTLSALALLGLNTFNYTEFFLAYVTWIVLAIGIVNGAMEIQKMKAHKKSSTENPA